jgi:subtilisin family serine protease
LAKLGSVDVQPVVAVIDSGLQLDSPQALAGYNAMDDSQDVQDATGHGTAVGRLVLKVAPHAKLLPVKVVENEEQNPVIVAKGIDWAVRQGAQVINLSLAMPNESPEIKAAIEKATAQGIPVIAASGNDGRPDLPFPAGSDLCHRPGHQQCRCRVRQPIVLQEIGVRTRSSYPDRRHGKLPVRHVVCSSFRFRHCRSNEAGEAKPRRAGRAEDPRARLDRWKRLFLWPDPCRSCG